MNSRKAERRDLTMSRLEGEIRRVLAASEISGLEALTVLTLVAGRIARDLVRDERAAELEVEATAARDQVDTELAGSPVERILATADRLVNRTDIGQRVITPDPVPELSPIRQRPGGKPHSIGPIIELD